QVQTQHSHRLVHLHLISSPGRLPHRNVDPVLLRHQSKPRHVHPLLLHLFTYSRTQPVVCQDALVGGFTFFYLSRHHIQDFVAAQGASPIKLFSRKVVVLRW
ncbi:unnamed protein product, partial [Ectocarpus sp. 12 AP-2014]